MINICKAHGQLDKQNIYLNGRCRLCQREWSKNNYVNNKEKILIRHSKNTLVWRSKNKDKVKEYNKKYWAIGVTEIRNNYVKDTLKRNSSLKISEIPLDLVDSQRAVILIKNKIIEIEDGNS